MSDPKPDVLERVQDILRRFGAAGDLLETRGLPLYEDAAELEVAEVTPEGRQHLLVPAAASAWRRLKHCAKSDGIEVFIVSAFRSFDRQVELVARKLRQGRSIDEILSVVAPPGCSEHHTGQAVDVGTMGCPPLEEAFDTTAAFSWMIQHAREFGFGLSYGLSNPCGFAYEPWHWCYGKQ